MQTRHLSRACISRKKIGMPEIYYLGPEGTFSHILARKRFGRRANLVACPAIEAIFDRVRENPSGLGLVPVENSSGGTVYDSVDAMIRNAGKIFLHEELSLDVRIALLGHAGQEITTIYSHFIQLKHHADWLKQRFPKARQRAVASTAIAAQKAKGSPHAAALASPGAADVYGLDVIEKSHAGSVNVTHFAVIGASPAPEVDEVRKTALIAALPNSCGSLHQFLGPFARQGVSLSRIVSRPVPGKPQTYVFFVEIEGGEHDAAAAKALARARKLSESLVSLGTFPVRGRFKS